MKSLLVAMTLLTSFSTFASVSSSQYCQGAGQEAINQQAELVSEGIASGKIDKGLHEFFSNEIKEMQANHDFLCKGIRISKGKLSAREEQLKLVSRGIETGEISNDLADFFLKSLK